MEIPQWAVSTFAIAFFLVLGLAGWAFRYLASRVSSDIEKLSDKVGGNGRKIDGVKEELGQVKERLVRVETKVNGNSGGGGGYHLTPPVGTPIRD
jgi:hypothetical protein